MIETEDLKKLKIGPHNLAKILKAGTVPDDKMWEKINPNAVERILGTTQARLTNLAKEGKFPPRDGEKGFRFYRLSQILDYYWNLLFGNTVDYDIKKEKHLKLQIENKERVKRLVPREVAEDRVVRLLRALKRMFIYIVKTSSPILMGCTNARQVEQVLMDKFKDIFELLEKESKEVEWSEEKEVDEEDIEE